MSPDPNLDAALRTNTRVDIADLHRTLSAWMIYVTHDQIEAMTLASGSGSPRLEFAKPIFRALNSITPRPCTESFCPNTESV